MRPTHFHFNRRARNVEGEYAWLCINGPVRTLGGHYVDYFWGVCIGNPFRPGFYAAAWGPNTLAFKGPRLPPVFGRRGFQ